MGTDLVIKEQQIAYVSKFDLVNTCKYVPTENNWGEKFKFITFYVELKKLKLIAL